MDPGSSCTVNDELRVMIIGRPNVRSTLVISYKVACLKGMSIPQR